MTNSNTSTRAATGTQRGDVFIDERDVDKFTSMPQAQFHDLCGALVAEAGEIGWPEFLWAMATVVKERDDLIYALISAVRNESDSSKQRVSNRQRFDKLCAFLNDAVTAYGWRPVLLATTCAAITAHKKDEARALQVAVNSYVQFQEAKEEQELYAAQSVIDAARRVLGGIDLDPCSCEEANVVVGAKQFFTRRDDGLRQEWRGRVWLFPPLEASQCLAFEDKLVTAYRNKTVTEAIVFLAQDQCGHDWGNNIGTIASMHCRSRLLLKLRQPGKKAMRRERGEMIYCGKRYDVFEKEFSQFNGCRRLKTIMGMCFEVIGGRESN